jgi:uncharacterized protein YbaR (Trm112 family)
MVDSKLLEILCCPETKQDLSLASDDVINRLNAKIRAGQVKNRGDQAVKDPVDAGLVREDGKYLYPIREDIPIMLIDEAIPAGFFSA